MLLVPAAPQLVEPLDAVVAGLVVVGEAAAVHPDRVAGGAELERSRCGRPRGRAARGRARRAAPSCGSRAAAPRASACPARRGSCRARRAAAPRRGRAAAPRATSRFCSPPESVRDRRGTGPARTGRRGRRRCTVSQSGLLLVAAGIRVSRRAPWAYAIWVAARRRARSCACSAGVELDARPRGPAAGRRTTSRSRTVESSRTCPTNWSHHAEPAGERDDALIAARARRRMIRSSVVLPAPFGADERDRGALADAEGDLIEQGPPSGRVKETSLTSM